MLLTGNFIEILVEANKWSTKIAGQLFTYNVKRLCFVDWDKPNQKLYLVNLYLNFNFQLNLDLGQHIYQQRPKWQNTSSNFLCSCPNA